MYLFSKVIIVLFIISLLSSGPCRLAVASNKTSGCHCFKERTYNPKNKFSSDSYILTTTTNSFISAWFNFDKKKIVMMKMKGGVQSDDLLIGLYLVALSGQHIEGIMDKRQRGQEWQTILASSEIRPTTARDSILSSIMTGSPARLGAIRIADIMLSRFFSINQQQIAALRQRHLTNKEITLLFTLSAKSGIKVGQLADLIQNDGFSYSQVAFNLGFQPNDIKGVIGELRPSDLRLK